MTLRSGDWHLLGHASDPVPASEYDVDRVASTYERRGNDLRSTHGALERLSRLDGWRGDAAESFAESADDRLGDLAKAATKYESAARALRRPGRSPRDSPWFGRWGAAKGGGASMSGTEVEPLTCQDTPP